MEDGAWVCLFTAKENERVLRSPYKMSGTMYGNCTLHNIAMVGEDWPVSAGKQDDCSQETCKCNAICSKLEQSPRFFFMTFVNFLKSINPWGSRRYLWRAARHQNCKMTMKTGREKISPVLFSTGN